MLKSNICNGNGLRPGRFRSSTKWHLRKILHQIWKLITEKGGEDVEFEVKETKHKEWCSDDEWCKWDELLSCELQTYSHHFTCSQLEQHQEKKWSPTGRHEQLQKIAGRQWSVEWTSLTLFTFLIAPRLMYFFVGATVSVCLSVMMQQLMATADDTICAARCSNNKCTYHEL